MPSTLRSNAGEAEIAINLAAPAEYGTEQGFDSSIRLQGKHWDGDHTHPLSVSIDGLWLRTTDLVSLRDHITTWTSQTLDRLRVDELSGEFELARLPSQRLHITFGRRSDTISGQNPVVSIELAAGALFTEFHFVTDQSCLTMFAEELSSASCLAGRIRLQTLHNRVSARECIMANIPFGQKIALRLRKLPVRRIQKAMDAAEAAGITLTPNEISAQLMCRGRLELVVEALVLAKREGIPTSWHELCAIDLAGLAGDFDPLSAVRESTAVHEFTISSFARDLKEPLEGFCRDGSRVRAVCRVHYRLPVSHVFGTRLDFVHERLAARIGAWIFDAGDPVRLKMSLSEHESSLLVLAKAAMPTVQKLAVAYGTAAK